MIVEGGVWSLDEVLSRAGDNVFTNQDALIRLKHVGVNEGFLEDHG
jgi:hypothetical protein